MQQPDDQLQLHEAQDMNIQTKAMQQQLGSNGNNAAAPPVDSN